MSNKPDLQRLLELQRLLHAFSKVDRTIHREHAGSMRLENDTEHSYNLAMTAWFLAPHFPDLNKDLVIRYALVHDLVEIHAGDTYIFGTESDIASKSAREKQALDKLTQDWADFPELYELIERYETKHDNEARFIYALDKILPIMTIYINEGYTWKKEGVNVKKLHDNKRDKVAVSPEIEPYYKALHQLMLKSPHLIPKE